MADDIPYASDASTAVIQKLTRVEIVIGKTSSDSKVVIDGQDVSSLIQGVTVDVSAIAPSCVTLRLVPGVARLTMEQEVLKEQLLLNGIPLGHTRKKGDGCICGYLEEIRNPRKRQKGDGSSQVLVEP